MQGKVRGRIAKAAISAALTGAMAIGGVAAPVSVALANTVKVNLEGDSTLKYDFYQVFKGSVTQNTDGDYVPQSDMDWASDTMKSAVYSFLSTWNADGSGSDYFEYLAQKKIIASETGPNGSTEVAAAQSAENVIAFISGLIKGDEAAGASVEAAENTINDGKKLTQQGTFTNALGKAVAAGVTADRTNATEYTSAAAGYLLVVPQGTTDSEYPVWVVNPGDDGTTVNIQHKDGQPTLLKQVKDGESGTFAKIDDIDSGEEAVYQLTVHLPGTITASTTATIEDTLADGLTYVASSASTDNGSVSVTQDGQKLTFTLTGAEETSDYNITYKATLNSSATTGADALNANSAVLTFDGKTTVANVADVATYKLNIAKIDEDGEALAGASFAILKGESYVQADGTLASTEYYFSVDGEGKLTVPFFLDADTYTIKEQAPQGYAPIDDFTLTVTSELDSELAEVKSLTAEASDVLITAEADKATGVITLTVPNENEIILPLTGMTPSQLGTIVGAILVAAGAIVIVRRRQQNAAQA